MQLIKVLQSVLFALMVGILVAGCGQVSQNGQSSADIAVWDRLYNIEQTDEGYRTTGDGPYLDVVVEDIDSPISALNDYMLITMSSSHDTSTRIHWHGKGQQWDGAKRLATFSVKKSEKPVTYLVDLNERGLFNGATGVRLNLLAGLGLSFKIHDLKFITQHEAPDNLLEELVQFYCCTSKLHYLPGEAIAYKVILHARGYQDRDSSKILEVRLLDDKGHIINTARRHFGLPRIHQIKELYGVFESDKALAPGRYRLEATSTDQRSGRILKNSHTFGVIDPQKDPFCLETPFKYISDFTVVRGPKGLWHVIGITGEFCAKHGVWAKGGQTATFSHSTTEDFRRWSYHPPVLSITDEKYPDGNGYYQDNKIWAPHIIKRGDTYYMFYTSVNQYVSQSISLATSKDLFHWEYYSKNPVFTLEGVQWADWHRDRWADCRDPMVLKEGNKYYLYVTARAAKGDDWGVVAVAESDDLVHWKNPRIAVRAKGDLESVQVWKSHDRFYMTTSAAGHGTYTSNHPMVGWQREDFPRPPVQQDERYVKLPIPSRSEEVVDLGQGAKMIISMPFRLLGNSLYFYKIKTDETGKPVGYESPFEVPMP